MLFYLLHFQCISRFLDRSYACSSNVYPSVFVPPFQLISGGTAVAEDSSGTVDPARRQSRSHETRLRTSHRRRQRRTYKRRDQETKVSHTLFKKYRSPIKYESLSELFEEVWHEVRSYVKSTIPFIGMKIFLKFYFSN